MIAHPQTRDVWTVGCNTYANKTTQYHDPDVSGVNSTAQRLVHHQRNKSASTKVWLPSQDTTRWQCGTISPASGPSMAPVHGATAKRSERGAEGAVADRQPSPGYRSARTQKSMAWLAGQSGYASPKRDPPPAGQARRRQYQCAQRRSVQSRKA